MISKQNFSAILLALLLIVLATTIFACSSRGWYEGFRTQQRQKCYGLPPGEYRACMEQAEMSYDSYQRQREEILQHK